MRLTVVLVLAAVVLAVGCSAPKGATMDQKKASIKEMRDVTLDKLYAMKPEVKEKIRNAAGYGVFSDIGTNIIFVTTGNGYGIVRDAKTGDDTYMKMAKLGLGIGLGAKDYRAVFIFKTGHVLNKFLAKGWEWGAEADAAAKSEKKGGSANSEASFGKDVEVYQMTETGLALQANVGGSKYWKDKELNP